jgi:hypothetical protein
MKQQGRVRVWKHGDVPKAFRSKEIDNLLLELHSFQGSPSTYSVPPSIEKLWTRADDPHDTIPASGEDDEEHVEIELIDLNHLKVFGSKEQSVFREPRSTVRNMPEATEDGNEETPSIHRRKISEFKKTSILQEFSSTDQNWVPQIMPTSSTLLGVELDEVDDLILDAMNDTKELSDLEEDVQEPECQMVSPIADGATSTCDSKVKN